MPGGMAKGVQRGTGVMAPKFEHTGSLGKSQ